MPVRARPAIAILNSPIEYDKPINATDNNNKPGNTLINDTMLSKMLLRPPLLPAFATPCSALPNTHNDPAITNIAAAPNNTAVAPTPLPINNPIPTKTAVKANKLTMPIATAAQVTELNSCMALANTQVAAAIINIAAAPFKISPILTPLRALIVPPPLDGIFSVAANSFFATLLAFIAVVSAHQVDIFMVMLEIHFPIDLIHPNESAFLIFRAILFALVATVSFI